MKIIVGVDLQGAYLPALQLLGKLGLKEAEVLFVQAAPTVDAMLPAFPIDGATIDLVQSTYRQAGEAALCDAEDEAKRLGIKSAQLLCVGPSAELLNECVERESAELVAVRTTHHGAWQSEFMGSVTRAVLLGGRVSVLIAKQDAVPERRLELVFATDGSEFNDRCVSRFLSMKPAGVEKVHVVSAWGLTSDLEHLLRHAVHHSEALNKELEASSQRAVDATASRLTAAGFHVTTSVVHGASDKVLRDAMRGTGADLLVVGAHGKNWIERLLIGSTSLHQVIDEPYNVLVLRP